MGSTEAIAHQESVIACGAVLEELEVEQVILAGEADLLAVVAALGDIEAPGMTSRAMRTIRKISARRWGILSGRVIEYPS